MKWMHLSDLHIGKRISEFSMLEDQRYILEQILQIAAAEQIDAVLLAGDIYDKSVPSAEAVRLADAFLTHLAESGREIFIISGNHDSAERLAFGSHFMRENIHVSPVFDGSLKPILLADESGEYAVYLLPFVKPVQVRACYPELAEVETLSYQEAVRTVLAHTVLNPARRNLLVAHQFVTGAVPCDAEEMMVGGIDQIDAALFSAFDYVALGHIHGAQQIGSSRIRYSGTPLKYSFSEVAHQKSVPIFTIKADRTLDLTLLPLRPLRDMRKLRGSYMELTALEYYQGTNQADYLDITLTDEEEIVDAIGKLRSIYPNIMHLGYDNRRTRETRTVTLAEDMVQHAPLELFATLYQQQNNQPMSQQQTALCARLIAEIWGE